MEQGTYLMELVPLTSEHSYSIQQWDLGMLWGHDGPAACPLEQHRAA